MNTHWRRLALKRLCRVSAAYGANLSSDAYQPDGVRFVRTTDILDSGELSGGGVYVDDNMVRDYRLQDGDLLLSRSGTVGQSFLYNRKKHGPCSYAAYLVRFSPGPALDPRFAYYYFKSWEFIVWLGTVTISSTIANVNGQKYAAMIIPVPPIDVQIRIVAHLDCETARIDTLIDRKQRFIDLLLEKRTALITHAVTKGLDPTVEMKDSGVAWLGRTPAHWPQVRLGYFARVLNGTTPSRNNPGYWVDGDVPWLSSGAVNEDRITEPSELITRDALAECSLSLIPAGSVLIGMIGQGRTRGMASILGFQAAINQNMAAIIPGTRIVGRYLQYQLQNMYGPIREYGRGGNQAALNCDLIRGIRLPLPTVQEQLNIATFLDTESAKLDTLAVKTRRSIELLKEYRTALISAAVTGQIDIPATEAAEEVA